NGCMDNDGKTAISQSILNGIPNFREFASAVKAKTLAKTLISHRPRRNLSTANPLVQHVTIPTNQTWRFAVIILDESIIRVYLIA
ncbi:hypothetical protein K0M31_004584, partial [Melipona bicolor]